jgi:hypothetical protein
MPLWINDTYTVLVPSITFYTTLICFRPCHLNPNPWQKNGPGVLKLKIIKQNMRTNLPAESRVELSVQYGSLLSTSFKSVLWAHLLENWHFNYSISVCLIVIQSSIVCFLLFYFYFDFVRVNSLFFWGCCWVSGNTLSTTVSGW